MLAGICRLLDWTAIRFATAFMPEAEGCDHKLAEAQRLIQSPDFIPDAVEAAKVQFGEENRIFFDTPRPTEWPENNVVHGRLYRCAEKWQERPTVLLLHGWNDAINHYRRFPKMAAEINRNGFNAATLEAPFHWQRRPRQLGLWSNFLCPDILRTTEAARQAIAETRAFAEWLRQQGCPSVGLLGVSLGGWLGGLTICHDSRFSCAVLQTPVACLDRLVEEAAFCRGLRLAWQGQRVVTGQLNLTECRPAIARKNILLIEACHDLFIPRDTMEDLWRAWDEPEIWRMKHGHISVMRAFGLRTRVIQWMASRLGEPAVK